MTDARIPELLAQIREFAERRGAPAEAKALARKAERLGALAEAARAAADAPTDEAFAEAVARARAAALQLTQRATRAQSRDDIAARLSEVAETTLDARDAAGLAADKAVAALQAIRDRLAATAPAPDANADGPEVPESPRRDQEKFSRELGALLRKLFANVRAQIDAENIHARTADIAKYLFYFDAHANYLKYARTGDARDYASAASWTYWTDQETIVVPRMEEGGAIARDGVRMIAFGTKTHASYPQRYHAYVKRLFGADNALIKYREQGSGLNEDIRRLKAAFYAANRPLVEALDYGAHAIEPMRYYESDDAYENGSCLCFLCGKKIASKEIAPKRTNSDRVAPPVKYKTEGHVEHAVPFLLSVLLGVVNAPLNYAYAHATCNASKSQKVPEVPAASPDRPSPLAIVSDYLKAVALETEMRDLAVAQNGGRLAPANAGDAKRRAAASAAARAASARGAERYFAQKVSEAVSERPERRDAAAIGKLYLYAQLSDFYALVAGVKRQSGGASPRPDPYAEFLSVYSGKVEGAVAWPDESRAAFLKSRYEAAFAFSLRYFAEWQRLAGAERAGATYEEFVAKRVDSLLEFAGSNAKKKPDDLVRRIIM